MQRVRDERGAVAVMVALLMVPLLGFAAVSVDVAALYSTRQQLQTAADAAALGVAQYCNRLPTSCTSAAANTVAQDLAAANPGSATTTVSLATTSKVTVRTSAVQSHLFAPAIGVSSTSVTASASVGWGSPTKGTAILPLVFSWCEWKRQTGGGLPSATVEYTIYLSKSSEAGKNDCTGPSNLVVPGGFGWLTTDAGGCAVTSHIGSVLNSDPGNSVPTICSSTDLQKAINHTVLLPVFTEMTGTGNGATYTVFGYAAFVTTGYDFGSQNSYNSPCGGNDRCIRGYFSQFVDASEVFSYGTTGPALGASILRLTP